MDLANWVEKMSCARNIRTLGGLTAFLAIVVTTSAVMAQAPTVLRLSEVVQLSIEVAPEKTPIVASLALDPSARLIGSAGDDHQVRVWDIRDGRLVRRLSGHTDCVRSLVIGPRGRVATGGLCRQIRLWDASSEQPYLVLPLHAAAIYCLAFNPTGSLLATGGFENKVRIYDPTSGRLVNTFEAAGPDVRAVAFSPDGRFLAAAGRGGVVRIWDVASGVVSTDLQGDRRRICALAFSPDGASLAAGGDGSEVFVWDVQRRAIVHRLAARPGKVTSLVFCGGASLAAGDTQNMIRLWDCSTGQLCYQMPGHTGTVAALVWDDASGRLFSGGFDTTVRQWRLDQPTQTAARP